jgi:beta-lactamase regulating signal transducer with metallopeptidase domain/outer membrane biosynthesis protein TonB
MLHYIIQAVAFQVLFLIIYDIFLRKETFFNLNRVYLLSTSILSLVIPFIKIERIKEVVSKDFVISLPEVLIGESVKVASTIDPQIAMLAGINLEPEPASIWNIILISGMCIATLILVYKIIKLTLLVSNNPKHWSGKVLIVSLLNSTKAFSFFNYIFLGSQLTPKESTSILEHEMVHIKQKHSLDLLFFELLRIVFWFNPLVYFYQNRIATLHEFIADAKVVKGQNKADYYDNLLTQVFETQQFSFVNPFFKQSLIKKRIVMLSKSKSSQINLMKYALLIPMVFIMLMYTSSYAQEKVMSSSSETENQDIQELTDEALFDKYYKEIVALGVDGANLDVMMDYVKLDIDKYVHSRERYLKLAVFVKYMSDKSIDRKSENSLLSENEIQKEKDKKPKFKKTYNEYLAWKKTDEAKQLWVAGVKDGTLRLFVEDLKNLSSEEKKKQETHLKQLKSDDSFYKLVVSDYYKSKVYDFGKEKNTFKFNATGDVEIIEIEDTTIIDSYAEIPFSIVDETPTFTFCESLQTNEERKQCMSDNIAKHVNKNFNIKVADSLGLSGRQRLNVIFKIDREGHVVDVKARAPHPALEVEAKRVIETLPQFIPGKHKGQAVVVPYSLPILFQIKGDAKINEVKEVVEYEPNTKLKEEFKDSDEVPFVALDVYPGENKCKEFQSNEEKKICFSMFVSKFVATNFNTNLAMKLGFSGRQRINVIFKIDKEGQVFDVKARAPHPGLEAEAKRVVSSLPQFSPGELNGKPVIVSYSLPILFQVHGKVNENNAKSEVDQSIEDVKQQLKEANAYQIKYKEVPFGVVDQVPMYEACVGLTSQKDIKKCVSKEIVTYVNKNFNTDLASKIGLKGKQQISVLFKITGQGEITGVRVRAPHPELENEATRVIENLPKFSEPGKHKGNVVTVLYSLPILFQVH